MAAAQPNVAGGGALDTLRALSMGIGASRSRQGRDLEQRLKVIDLSRRLEHDAILAEARRAEAERDRARAALDLHNATKKPATLQEKLDEAMKIPGMTIEKATIWAMTGKLPDAGPQTPMLEITPEVADYNGIAYPTREETTTAPVQVPTTDPANDPRTVDVTRTRQVPAGPIRVSQNIGTTVLQNWGRRPSPQATAASRLPAPSLQDTENGLQFIQLNPDGTVTKVDTGERRRDQRRVRGSGAGGSGSGGGGPITPARALQITRAKDTAFTKIGEAIDKDEDFETNADSYIQRAQDAQRAYENAIVSQGGSVPAEASQAQMAAVRQMVIDRIDAKKAREAAKASKAQAASGGGSIFDALSWGKSSAPPPQQQPVYGEYVPGKGVVRR
jgi:hypothetical protein